MSCAARASSSDMGRQTTGRRPEAIGSESRRSTSHPPRSSRTPPGARDTSRTLWCAVIENGHGVSCDSGRSRQSVPPRLSTHELLGTARPHSPHRRSAGCAGALAGTPGPLHRIAKGLNRILRRRGPLFADRYHARALRTPRELRNALIYVLQNWKKHVRGAFGLDKRSSAAWFTGWARPVPMGGEPPPVRPALTWLGAVGWRRLGLLRVEERPAAVRRRR